MVNSKKLYRDFCNKQDALMLAFAAKGDDPDKLAENVCDLFFTGGRFVGYNEGFKSAIWCLAKGAIAGLALGTITAHVVDKAIEEEGGAVQYGPFTFSKKED